MQPHWVQQPLLMPTQEEMASAAPSHVNYLDSTRLTVDASRLLSRYLDDLSVMIEEVDPWDVQRTRVFDLLIHSILYLGLHEQAAVSEEVRRRIVAVVESIERRERFRWFETLALRLISPEKDVQSYAVRELAANMCHHRSVIRSYLEEICWLARAKLSPRKLAQEVLKNVELSQLGDGGIAVLWSICESEASFL